MIDLKITEIKNISDLYYKYSIIDSVLSYRLSEILTGKYDTETDPVYSVEYDWYDNSFEINFSPHIPFDYTVSQELVDFVLKECGFSRAWFNFLDNTEQHVYIAQVQEGDKWVNGETVICPRKLVSYDKKRIERYLEECGTDDDKSDLLNKWKDAAASGEFSTKIL